MRCHDVARRGGAEAHIPVPVLEAVELADEEAELDEEDDDAEDDDAEVDEEEVVDDVEELDVVPEPPPAPPAPAAGTIKSPPGSSNSGATRAPLHAASAKTAKKSEARFMIPSSTRRRRRAKFFARRTGPREAPIPGVRHRSPRHAIARP